MLNEDDGLHKWLLLSYRVPRSPSARRVYVWRKLKQLAAVALQDATWILPDTPRNQEQFQWLAAEVEELGGEATVWQAQPLFGGQDKRLVRQFQDQADAAYREILKGLRRKSPDLPALSLRYQQALALDYFPNAMGRRVREALLAAQGGGEK